MHTPKMDFNCTVATVFLIILFESGFPSVLVINASLPTDYYFCCCCFKKSESRLKQIGLLPDHKVKRKLAILSLKSSVQVD